MIPRDESRSDSDLWRAAIEGDPSAFGAVFDRHVDQILTACTRRLGSRDDGEDATLEVFVVAWQRASRVHFVDDSALPWLLAVAANVARTRVRTRSREQRRLLRMVPDTLSADTADEAIAAVERETVAASVANAISHLPRSQQMVVMLCDLGELSYAEVSEMLNVPVGTIKSRRSRAFARLQTLLQDTQEIGQQRSLRAGHNWEGATSWTD